MRVNINDDGAGGISFGITFELTPAQMLAVKRYVAAIPVPPDDDGAGIPKHIVATAIAFALNAAPEAD